MNRTTLALVLLLLSGPVAAQLTLREGSSLAVDAAADGRLTMDLAGRIWIVPPGGGEAEQLTNGDAAARRPQFSPDDRSIVYQATVNGLPQIRLYRIEDGSTRTLGDANFLNQHPRWHPSGERIVFSSDRSQSGFDLWEYDLETGLAWRISHETGDEMEPAWSADGRNLVYVRYRAGRWSIVLRRMGRPDEVLARSQTRLSAPAWRPDGSLITFRRESPAGSSIDMAILSDPPLIRPLLTGEDIHATPVSWLTRQQFFYTADGKIRRRNFNSWTSQTVRFRATVKAPEKTVDADLPTFELLSHDMPTGRRVIRTSRLFDGIGGGYQDAIDIVIDGGLITALEPRRDRPGEIVIELGDTTALPGFIDSLAALPPESGPELGPLLLSLGVTTVVAAHAHADRLNRLWSGKDMPGPRLLDPGGAESIAAILRGTDSLADSNTGGLAPLLEARQAKLLPSANPKRRFVEIPDLEFKGASLVVASAPNGLPPGLALQAEFLALTAAGLEPAQVLRSAGVNASAYLELGLQLGRLAPGSRADIVIVDGDPLADAADLRKIVGVVRNGRFYSAIGLIERARQAAGVE